MHRFAMLVPLLLVTACGGADFAGTYKGPVTFKMTCPGAEAYEETLTDTMTVVDTADGIAIKDDGDCPNIPATVNGNSATITKTTCAPVTDGDGTTTTVTMTGGTLALNGTSLNVSLTASAVIAGSDGTLTCPASFAGTLAKQAD